MTDPTATRWMYRPVEHATAEDAQRARDRGEVLKSSAGTECVPIAVTGGELSPGQVDELEAYREAIERFGSEVLGCEWAARAIHDARRRSLPVALPQGRDFYYVSDVDLCEALEINVAAGEPVSALELGDALWRAKRLVKRLEAAQPHPAQRQLQRARQELISSELEHIDERTAKDPLSASQLAGHRKCIERWREWQTPSPNRKSWDGAFKQALESARHVLGGRGGVNRARKGKERAAPYLNASVNGTWQAATPLEPTDMGDRYFLEYLSGATALGDAHALRRPPHTAQPSQHRTSAGDVTDEEPE